MYGRGRKRGGDICERNGEGPTLRTKEAFAFHGPVYAASPQLMYSAREEKMKDFFRNFLREMSCRTG